MQHQLQAQAQPTNHTPRAQHNTSQHIPTKPQRSDPNPKLTHKTHKTHPQPPDPKAPHVDT
ncbi:hypothetical protein BDN70DRAFT_873877 [Pholiota conissans]|uniref:Uncharacterized protein n=1 Tax=Pholiota conissans TaxID=109636 RepID=A0A9P5Z9F8_9AGAR|nr:hypothetical protein BDN70DRAFT_873877 [Pholiota conissans]